MGNCFPISSSPKDKSRPVDDAFKFPSPLPIWPQGDGFSSGYIDLGGLQVYQATSLTKIWATYEGGPDNLGVTFFEPTLIPDEFFMLGCYAQPNNQPLFGWVLVAKDKTTKSIDLTSSPGNQILEKPIDYTLIWSSNNNNNRSGENSSGYMWLPIPPDGYKALGHIVTTSPEKPSVEKIRCVRLDFTDECEAENLIWGDNAYGIYNLRPKNRGVQAQGVSVGTFNINIVVQNDGNISTNQSSPLACLKNNNFNNLSSFMPNLTQIETLIQTYSPRIYFHPNEVYLPSSVNWFFSQGVRLYKQGAETDPVAVEPNGANLPQGGSNDGLYWLDLPEGDETVKENVKKGDLSSSEAYLHIKPMLGGTFTDIAIWVFFPFNGPSTAKLGLIDIPLGKIGEHVGDWEHITLRISNFNGVLYRVFLSQHSGGSWIDSPLLEFQDKSNKFVTYSARNGHAMYSQPGLVMQGTEEIGLRNDTAKSEMVMDTWARFSIVSGGEYLVGQGIVEPPWLNYLRKWGPKITYTLGVEVEMIENLLPGESLKTSFSSLVDALPNEIFGEDGVTGPKVKNNWLLDE